jgi:hypothetical protein
MRAAAICILLMVMSCALLALTRAAGIYIHTHIHTNEAPLIIYSIIYRYIERERVTSSIVNLN